MRIVTRASIALAVIMLAAGGARAAIVLASEAEGAAIHITVGGRSVMDYDAGLVSGSTSTAAYDKTAAAANVSQRVRLVDGLLTDTYETLTTGAIAGEALATPASLLAKGTVSVASTGSTLSNQLLNFLPTAALSLTSGTINSTSTAGVGSAGLYATGTSTIGGLGFSGSILDGLGITGTIYNDPDANTRLVTLPGLSIILNEQIKTLTGTSAAAIDTNAVHILFSDYAINGALLNGDIILGHSRASISGYVIPSGPVPEPATWLTMIFGFGFVGTVLRRQRRCGTTLPMAG